MRLPRWLRWVLAAALGLAAVVAVVVGAAWWWLHPAFERTGAVVYTRSKGRDLSFDVLRPAHPNGAGVIVMVSGRWQSRRGAIPDVVMAPLLRRGYTLFAVTHGSQPEFTVMEMVSEVQRAVRFIRHRARSYGVDPNRLGVAGGSSGGHLGLMLATRGGPGRANAADPVERESSAVQAAAVFYPPTDLLNLGASTENPGNGGPPKSFVKAFGPNSTNLAVWKIIGREMSPIYHISSNLPPVLIIHGGADTLVPLDQSERFVGRARQLGRPIELVVRPGKRHGWPTMILDLRLFADWFDRWLVPPAK